MLQASDILTDAKEILDGRLTFNSGTGNANCTTTVG